MRVLHAVHGTAPEFLGGVEAYVAAVAAGQRAGGHDAYVVSGSDRADGDPRVVEEEVGGVPVFRLVGLAPHTERLRDRPDAEELFRGLLRALRPDLVHVHSWLRLPPTLAALAASEKVPAVATLHDLGLSCPRVHRLKADLSFCRVAESLDVCVPCVRRDPWETDAEVADELEQRALLLAAERSLLSAVLAPSDAQRRLLEEVGAFPPGRVEVLPVALPALPAPAGRAAPAAAGLAVGHWGNLLPAKGTHLLAEAVASLPEPLGVSLHLFGVSPDPAFGDRLRAAAAGRAVFHGAYAPADVSAVPLDAAAFPSLAHESHSFTLDEAFSLGLPVVVSDRGALAERVGGRGLVVPAGDVPALASALRRLAEKPGLLAALRAAPPAEPPTPFDEHLSRLAEVYERVVRNGAAAPGARPTDRERLVALARRASRRLADAIASREELGRFRAEATGVVRARDVELQRLYDAESALTARMASLDGQLADARRELDARRADVETAREELDVERRATGAARGQLEALLARRSVRAALRLSRLLGRG